MRGTALRHAIGQEPILVDPSHDSNSVAARQNFVRAVQAASLDPIENETCACRVKDVRRERPVRPVEAAPIWHDDP